MPQRSRFTGRSRSSAPSAPSRSMSTSAAPPRASPAPPRAPPPAPKQKTTTTPATQTAPAASSSGSGLLGNIASAAAGSFIGNSIANSVFGGRSSEGSGESVATADGYQQQQQQQEDVCFYQSQDFLKCLQQNKEGIGACQWTYQALESCRANNYGQSSAYDNEKL